MQKTEPCGSHWGRLKYGHRSPQRPSWQSTTVAPYRRAHGTGITRGDCQNGGRLVVFSAVTIDVVGQAAIRGESCGETLRRDERGPVVALPNLHFPQPEHRLGLGVKL